MKRLLFLIFTASLLFSGCQKDKDEVTAYTLICKVPYSVAGYSIDVMMYEYNSTGERIDSNFVVKPQYKKEYKFYPNAEAKYLKMKLISSENTIRWANKYFYLVPQKNIDIEAGLKILTDENCYSLTEP